MNGTLDDKAQSSLSDQELLSQFKRIEQMPEDRKRPVKEVLDAFILKSDLQQSSRSEKSPTSLRRLVS